MKAVVYKGPFDVAVEQVPDDGWTKILLHPAA